MVIYVDPGYYRKRFCRRRIAFISHFVRFTGFPRKLIVPNIPDQLKDKIDGIQLRLQNCWTLCFKEEDS